MPEWRRAGIGTDEPKISRFLAGLLAVPALLTGEQPALVEINEPAKISRACAQGWSIIMVPLHAVHLSGTRFWVTHRRCTYGPFDYEWSADFHGVELLYAGCKFGEYCSADEVYADLKPFALPMSVVQVTSIVMGCVLYGVLNGLTEAERRQLVNEQLVQLGYARFCPCA